MSERSMSVFVLLIMFAHPRFLLLHTQSEKAWDEAASALYFGVFVIYSGFCRRARGRVCRHEKRPRAASVTVLLLLGGIRFACQ